MKKAAEISGFCLCRFAQLSAFGLSVLTLG
ncbi:hypothetical protein MCEMAEM4_01141 [Burkholderiaceae bacterium]